MTVQKAVALQNQMRELFRKFGIDSCTYIFQADGQIHVQEVVVTELNPFIKAFTDASMELVRTVLPDAPVTLHNTETQN